MLNSTGNEDNTDQLEKMSHAELLEKYKDLQKENQLLKTEGPLDPTTRLINRKYSELGKAKFESAYEKAIEEYGADSVWLVVIDVNNMKALNDAPTKEGLMKGHKRGDYALRKIADTLAGQTKAASEKDVPARNGGDEFVLLLADVTEEEVQEILSRIDNELEKISQNDPIFKEANLNLSLSHGYARVKKGVPSEEILEEADGNMYTHKRASKPKIGKSVSSLFDDPKEQM